MPSWYSQRRFKLYFYLYVYLYLYLYLYLTYKVAFLRLLRVLFVAYIHACSYLKIVF